MYDMADHRISVRIPQHLGQRLRQRSKLKGVPESELVREALDSYLPAPQKVQSAYDAAVALGVIGCAKGLPRDLSTNPKYMKGFGEDRGD
jgi:predicted DNA-binding protein